MVAVVGQPINLPLGPLFCPSLTVLVRDTKLGGLVHTTIGMASIPLVDKVNRRCGAPWVLPAITNVEQRVECAAVYCGLPPSWFGLL